MDFFYTLFVIFITFFKIGLFTFGGGYAMIPLIEREITSLGFATPSEIVDFIGISESTPGVFAINIATFIGMRTAGVPGAICATLGVVLPSFLIILFVAKLFSKFYENSIVKAGFEGLRPATVGLIIAVGVRLTLLSTVKFDTFTGILYFFVENIHYLSIGLIGGFFYLYKKYKLHPAVLVGISAAVGIVFGYLNISI